MKNYYSLGLPAGCNIPISPDMCLEVRPPRLQSPLRDGFIKRANSPVGKPVSLTELLWNSIVKAHNSLRASWNGNKSDPHGPVFEGQHPHRNPAPTERQTVLRGQFAKLLAKPKVEVQPPASHQELMKIFNIPYSYSLLSKDGISDVYPMRAGEALKDARQIVVGDMHASFLKLMETLVVSDLVEMSEKTARELKELTHRLDDRSLSVRKMTKTELEIEELLPAIRWKGGDRQLFLIGDMLSDRGPSDRVILSLVKHLRRQVPPDSIVSFASNHDHNVLTYLMTEEEGLVRGQAVSMTRAIEVAKNTGRLPQLEQDYADYLAHSKLLYLDKASKTLISHAPISQTELRRLHDLLPKATPHPDDIKDLNGVSDFVDAANQFYQDYVLLNWQMGSEGLHGEWKDVLAKRREQVEPVLADGIKGFLWVRRILKYKHQLPFYNAGLNTFLHGHDMRSQDSPFSPYYIGPLQTKGGYPVITLDNTIRKGAEAKYPPHLGMLNPVYKLS
jgi:hypothetical protein